MAKGDNFLMNNWAGMMAGTVGFLLILQLSEKTDSIKANTEALGELNTSMALNSQAINASRTGLSALSERVRDLERKE